LLEAGHETLILDYSTVGTVERMAPQELRSALADAYEVFLSDMKTAGKLNEKTSNLLVELDKNLEQHKEGEFIRIADEIINKIEEVKADFIGFKLWTGDGFYGSEKIARHIKGKYPDLKIFAGGPHVDWFKENILHYTDIFDAIAYGEGEETISLLAEYVEGKRRLPEVPNLIYEQNGEIKFTELKRMEDLNLLPDPVYDEEIYPAMRENQKIKFIMIDESRGCPNACHFCIHPQKSGNRWRLRDVTKIVNLMEKLRNKLGTNAFRLAGSNTPARLKNELALEIINRGLKVRYVSYGHARDVDIEDYEMLHKSGCVSLFFGVESGNQEILDKDINKGIKVEQIIRALKKAKRANLLTVASIIAPCPHDTSETLKQTLDVLVEANPDSVVMSLPGVIPNTQWYVNSGKFGFKLNEDYIEKSMMYRIRLLLPPILWEPLPYRIGGKTHYEAIAMAQWLATELEKKRIITGIEDYLLLAASYLNISREEARDKSRRLFFTGDYSGIERMVTMFNERVTAP
jgi:radical SAM superfamily enzyme YgiQ (UPF0313 family)